MFACSPDGGGRAGSAACRAAVAANGAPFTAWDNLRVANVAGRDRRMIPDGKLCSGGLPAYKGLDLPRGDWPSTPLVPGAGLTMRYASTIPHRGTFKLYLTKPGYDPTKPLTWKDIPARPFAEVTDPALTGGAYRIGATLPADRTGRHVLFTIWQNSSTPDTYYSCSDVMFAKATSGKSAPAKETKGAKETTVPARQSAEPTRQTTEPAQRTPASAVPRVRAGAPDNGPVASGTGTGSGPSAPLLAGGAAAVLMLTGGAALVLRLRRR